MPLRKLFFWLHLVAALAAGIVIFILCLTGAVLGMNQRLTAWAERDVRWAAPHAAGAPHLSVSDALAAAAKQQPSLVFVGATLIPDPDAAILLNAANRTTWAVDPYSGQVRIAEAPRVQALERSMTLWHVALGDALGRATGVKVVGIANGVFLFLLGSGLILWWPRMWSWRTVRPLIWFMRSARGRTRDWNWHNTVAIWSLPVLTVLVGTGLVMSSLPVNRWMWRMAGQPLAPDGRPAPYPSQVRPVETKVASVLSLNDFVGRLQELHPDWTELRLSLGKGADSVHPLKSVSADIQAAHAWPPFDTITARWLDRTGVISEKTFYTSSGPGMRLRRWVRLLHSGDAFNGPSRFIAILGCLAGCFLVWTGYSMAYRRFFMAASRQP